jgi:hypothetical protein
MSQQKDQPLTDEIESTLQMIIDKALRSASQQKGHKLMNETEHTPQIIIKRTKGGRGRARQDHLVNSYAWYFKAIPSKFSCATFQTFKYFSFCATVFSS